MTINSTDLNITYQKHIEQLLDGPYKEWIPYMVTVSLHSFYPDHLGDRHFTTDGFPKIWNAHNHFYRDTISRMMSNFTKKHHLHPRTFDFIDFENTKKNSNRYIANPTSPHIHSIWLIHPDHVAKFEMMMLDEFDDYIRLRSNKHVTSVHAARIGPTAEDRERVTSYSSKFANSPQGRKLSKQIDLFNQYPRSPSELKTRRHPQERFHDDFIGTSRRENATRLRELAT